ncbi:hypothetical protein ES705_38191 [subsurface metagenome]
METQPVRQEPEAVSSLDIESTSARQSWLRKKRSRRMFHRVISGLKKAGAVRLVTLTSRAVDDNEKFQRDFRCLRMRLLRRRLLVDYIRCPEFTKGGLRHEHILFRGSYIDQRYLSAEWERIHGARVVDIRRVRGGRGLAGYMASYMAKAPAGRYCYSWGWVWKGFAGSWKALCRFYRESSWTFQDILTFWDLCIRLDKRPEAYIPI